MKELRKDFADDAQVYISGDDPMPVADFIAAEEAMYLSFPDMTIEYDEDKVDDGKGNGIVELDAIVTGTFKGADYIVGDKTDAIVATGKAVSKQTTFTFTYENEKIVKLQVIGLDPFTLYDEVAVATD